MLVFVVEVMMGEVKMYDYRPTNSPPMSLQRCLTMKSASNDMLDCIEVQINVEENKI